MKATDTTITFSETVKGEAEMLHEKVEMVAEQMQIKANMLTAIAGYLEDLEREEANAKEWMKEGTGEDWRYYRWLARRMILGQLLSQDWAKIVNDHVEIQSYIDEHYEGGEDNGQD